MICQMVGAAVHRRKELTKWGPTSLHFLVVVSGSPLGLFGTEGLGEKQLAVFPNAHY